MHRPPAPQTLLQTSAVRVEDTACAGEGPQDGEESARAAPHLIFPYRGAYHWHARGETVVAEPGVVLLGNAGESGRAHHVAPGAHASLTVTIDPALLWEIARADAVCGGLDIRFAQHALRIDSRAQAMAALLRHSLVEGAAETLEAESLALTLAHRAVGPKTSHLSSATASQRRLVERIKVVLASDLGRRWTLADIAAEVGGSPVYLTQVFREVEGVPLYRHQLRQRLSRALELIGGCEDLTTLALDLGFSSHSHFTAAFSQHFGRSPSAFRVSIRKPTG